MRQVSPSVWLSARRWLCLGRNKELVTSSCVKKKSPSQIRQEQKRKEEGFQKKATLAAEEVAKASEAKERGRAIGT